MASMKTNWRKRIVAGACIAQLVSLPALAQQTAPPAKQAPAAQTQAPATLKVTTRLVQVNVVAQDKHGQPVTDLTKDDFTILDQKQPQKVAVFSMETNRVLTSAQPLPPNTFTNRYEQKSGAPTAVTVVLLDGLNTQFHDMAYARGQVIKFLEQLQPQDRVALYTLTGELRVLHDFTSDATSLIRAVQRYKGHYSTELAAADFDPADTGNQLLDDFLNAANQRMADFYTTNRVLTTCSALEAIANHLAGVPGRKNLVWVSGAFPFYINLDADFTPANATLDRRTFHEEVDRSVRALNNANLAIYPVDARGLIGVQFPTTRGLSVSPRANPGGAIQLSPSRANFDTMTILADRTGGRAYYNTNDIRGSIRKAIDDARVTYVLGFYPANQNWDGKFRELKVQVNRPGVQLRFRRGYYALAEQQLDAKQRQAVLREAIASPIDATELGFDVNATPVEIPGTREVKADFHVAQRDVTLEHEGDTWNGALDVLFVQMDAKSKVIKGETKTIQLHLSQMKYEQVQRVGAIFTLNAPIVANAAQVRVVVRDVSSGSVGSITIPLAKLFSDAPPMAPVH